MAAINTLDLGGMTPDLVYQKLQQSGVSEVDAGLLVSGWIYQNFGNVQRTFAYAVPFDAVDINCAAATFTRSFHHSDWVDGESVVQAQETTGEDGFNLRFHRIEGDIDGLAAEIAKLYACVAAMRSQLHDRLDELKAEINRIDGDVFALQQHGTSVIPGRYSGLIDSPNFVASTTIGKTNVMLWQTQNGLLALPATTPLAGDPLTDQRVQDAADFGRFMAENTDAAAAFGTTGITKQAFVQKFGSDTTASGRTIADVLQTIPDSATFTNAQALNDALSQSNAASITSSTANLPGVMGVALGTTVTNASNAGIDTLTTLTPQTRTALAAAGFDTVGKLSAANPADVTKALSGVSGVSKGDVGAIVSTARTIRYLGR